MTRKDYELIAGAFFRTAERLYEGYDATAEEVFDEIVCNLAVELLRDNPRFDTKRFITACGGAT